MTSEESILFLGKTAQKLDQLASAFLEVKLRQEEASEKDRKAKEKNPSGKDGKEIARDGKGRFQRKEIKISEPSQNLKMLAEIEKEAKKQNKLNLQEKAPKVAENLTSTERKRWENIGTILATAFKKILEGRQKVTREKGIGKEIQDLEFIENEKLEKKKTSFFKKLLGALAFLSGFVLGVITETIKQLRKIFSAIKALLNPEIFLNLLRQLKNSKFGKYVLQLFELLKTNFLKLIEGVKNSKTFQFFSKIFENLKTKFLELLKIIRESKVGKFVEGIFKQLKTNFLNLIENIKNSKVSKVVTQFFESLKTNILKAIETAKNSNLVQIVKNLFQNIKTSLSGISKALSESKLGSFVIGIFEGISTKLGGLVKSVREIKITNVIPQLFSIIQSKFLGIFKSIGEFFSSFGRILNIIEKGKGPLLFMEKLLKPIPEFLKFIVEGPLKIIFKGLQLGLKVGRLFGKLLIPLAVVLELFSGLFKAFSDEKLSNKSFIQKLITGVVAGIGGFLDIFSIFGLEFFNFDEIRDRIDKIFKPFQEGKWIQGIGQILNQTVSFFLAIPGKILGWVVGWFSKDLGKKVTDYFRNFNLFETIKDIIMFVPNMFGNVLSKIKNFFSGEGDGFISKIFENINKIFEYSPIGLLMKGAKKLISMFGNEFNMDSIVNGIKTFFKYTPVGMLLESIDYIKEAFSNFSLDSVINGIKTFFKYTPVGMLLESIDYIKEAFSNFSIDGILNSIKQFFNYTPIGMLINNSENIKSFFGDTFGKIKNFFTFVKDKFDSIFGFIGDLLSKIFNFIKDKAKNIPLIGKLFENTEDKQETYVENKKEKIPLVQNPFEMSEEQPSQFIQSFQSPENQDFQSPENQDFQTQSMFQVPEINRLNETSKLFSMEKKSSSPEGFGDVKTGMENLNKNSSVNSKIAVDQLREIKELNKKMEQLVAQLTSSRAMVVNNVRNSSVNSFLQPSTINSFRSSFRE